jgi:hypothetical protein
MKPLSDPQIGPVRSCPIPASSPAAGHGPPCVVAYVPLRAGQTIPQNQTHRLI